MNKKLLLAVGTVALTIGVYAAPHHGPMGGHNRPAPMHHQHHGNDFWGRGGRNFWPGFVGGLIGGAIVSHPPAVVERPPVVIHQPAPVVVAQPAPVVVASPTVQQVQNVWVEGRYVDQVQPNGVVIRVWQPGHYEQRTVVL